MTIKKIKSFILGVWIAKLVMMHSQSKLKTDGRLGERFLGSVATAAGSTEHVSEGAYKQPHSA